MNIEQTKENGSVFMGKGDQAHAIDGILLGVGYFPRGIRTGIRLPSSIERQRRRAGVHYGVQYGR